MHQGKLIKLLTFFILYSYHVNKASYWAATCIYPTHPSTFIALVIGKAEHQLI